MILEQNECNSLHPIQLKLVTNALVQVHQQPNLSSKNENLTFDIFLQDNIAHTLDTLENILGTLPRGDFAIIIIKIKRKPFFNVDFFQITHKFLYLKYYKVWQ